LFGSKDSQENAVIKWTANEKTTPVVMMDAKTYPDILFVTQMSPPTVLANRCLIEQAISYSNIAEDIQAVRL